MLVVCDGVDVAFILKITDNNVPRSSVHKTYRLITSRTKCNDEWSYVVEHFSNLLSLEPGRVIFFNSLTLILLTWRIG